MHEFGVDGAHADVAMARTLDPHLVAIGLLIEVRRYGDRIPANRALKRLGRRFCRFPPGEIDRDTTQHGLERFAVDDARHPLDHRFG